jgi:hypothetical protein
MSFDWPYGLSGRVGANSVTGTLSGSPYTAAVDENTSRLMPQVRQASMSPMLFSRLLR